MSQLNGLGPNNQGSIAGRGLGKCNNGYGYGYGFRRGRGCFCGAFITRNYDLTKEEIKADLEAYRVQLKAELKALDQELDQAK